MSWYRVTPAGQLTLHSGLPTLDELKAAVGGYIESVPIIGLPVDITVLCNEERWAIPDELRERNMVAIWICGIEVVGPVALAGRPDEDGELTSLPVPLQRLLAKLAAAAQVLHSMRQAEAPGKSPPPRTDVSLRSGGLGGGPPATDGEPSW